MPYPIFVVLLIFVVAALVIKFDVQISKTQEKVYRVVGKGFEKIGKLSSKIRRRKE